MTDSLVTDFLRSCQNHGVVHTRYALLVSIAQQSAVLIEKGRGVSQAYRLRSTFRCSTSKFGIGEKAGSNMTPRGLHRITEKIGGGCPVGTVFKGRKVIGYTWQGMPNALITTRSLWLDGLEPGFNRGGDVDSHARYIYIHGTGDEGTIGRPASHGCVQLASVDLVPLYDRLTKGTLVWITEG